VQNLVFLTNHLAGTTYSNEMSATSAGWGHLVNAYEGKADMV